MEQPYSTLNPSTSRAKSSSLKSFYLSSSKKDRTAVAELLKRINTMASPKKLLPKIVRKLQPLLLTQLFISYRASNTFFQ